MATSTPNYSIGQHKKLFGQILLWGDSIHKSPYDQYLPRRYPSDTWSHGHGTALRTWRGPVILYNGRPRSRSDGIPIHVRRRGFGYERAALTRGFGLSLLVVFLGGGAACTTAPIYTEDHTRLAIGAVPDRRGWKAGGTLTDAPNAIDGNLHTAAVANDGTEPASLVIDLGKAGFFNMIVVDHGREEFGFARRVVIQTSMDGKTFEQQYAAAGTRRVSNFLLVTSVLARFIRLEAVVPGTKPWSVAEVHVQ